MASKIQGEGDYESAREYNRETRRFVEKQRRRGEPLAGSSVDASDELKPEEKEALSRAKSGSQDKKDAEIFREKPEG